MLLVFSVDDSHYFAADFHLDVTRSKYKMYPDPNGALAVLNVSAMMHSLSPDRWQRYSRGDQWAVPLPWFRETARWPLHFVIANDPINDTVTYRWRDGVHSQNVINAEYTSSFPANKGMTVYISGDSPNEQFVIKSINISHDVHPSPSPTTSPSASPTISPTAPNTNSTATVSGDEVEETEFVSTPNQFESTTNGIDIDTVYIFCFIVVFADPETHNFVFQRSSHVEFARKTLVK